MIETIVEEPQEQKQPDVKKCADFSISIILPTNKQPKALQSVFETLLNQKGIKESNIELIVVDNTKSGVLKKEIPMWAERFPWAFRYLHEARRGVPLAMNAGIHCAKHSIVTFLADDMILADDYLQSIQQEFLNQPGISVMTSRVKLPEGYSWNLATNDYESEREFRYPCDPGTAGAGNGLHIKREVFERIGIFDEVFGGGAAAGEDNDLIYRILKAGYTIHYSPKIVSYHYHVRNSEKDYLRSIQVYGKGCGIFFAKYILKGDWYVMRLFAWTWEWILKTVLGAEDGQESNLSRSTLRKKALAAASGILLGMVTYPFAFLFSVRQNKIKK